MNEEPLIQIGNDLFKGKYGHPSGTHLVLKVTPDQGSLLLFLIYHSRITHPPRLNRSVLMLDKARKLPSQCVRKDNSQP